MKVSTLFVTLLFIGCSLNAGAAQDVSPAGARASLSRGDYKAAINIYGALLAKNPDDGDSLAGLLQARRETGDYGAAEQQAREFLKSHASNAAVRMELGEIEFVTGRFGDAATDAERASRDAKAPLSLRATLLRARALFAQGKEDEARTAGGEIIRFYNEGAPQSAEALTLIARAAVYLERFKDANELFIDARQADPTFTEAFIAQGELLNQKYNYGDAASLFQDALKINPNSADALIGLATSKRFESSGEASALIDKALQVNVNHPVALSFRAWLDLEDDKPEQSLKSIQKALAVNPNSIEAIAVSAASKYLADKRSEMDSESSRAAAINPRSGEVFETLAHFAVIKRRYEDAVEFGKRAVELAPRLWSARTELGIQLLRAGKISEGRAELERAFTGDPYNIWAKNTLDLLDSMKDFADSVRGPFIIRSSQKESPVLSPYAAELLDEAHRTLTAKYRFTPRAPISVELFANHEDFAVRSLGLPGLGALGVCFGQVVAMDSPAARHPGEFNWGSTLWHEFTHVITLQMTNNRIPRWFSEGLSVYEERRARPGWGDDWSLQNLKAYKDGRFVKINDLDAAFIRPKSPDGVPLAYFQASQVCEFIDAKFGFDAILKMLALYKDGATDQDALQKALQLTPENFDRAFDDYIKSKTAGWLSALGSLAQPAGDPPSKEALQALARVKPNDYFVNLRLGGLYKADGSNDLAIEHLKKAAELFPYYGADGNPYWLLADIYEASGRKQEAADALQNLIRHNETNADALGRLAGLRVSLGDKSGAADALRQAFYISPFDPRLHKLAGGIYLETGHTPEAIREFRVQIALAPPDLAEAHYDLARALDAGGNRAEARREVLRSLEIAPGFEKAQELLLKLRSN